MAKTTNGIIYPSDYGAVADIPNDLKIMSESIDELLNKYSLVTESGNQIRLVFEDTTNKFKAILNDKNGNKLSESDEIDLGINVMITDIAYNDKKLIITLKNGKTKSVSISSLIDGLVNEDDFNKLSDKNVVIENELTELAQQMPWKTTEIAKTIHIEDSAKYSRNKLDLFGDLVQEKREGYNCIDLMSKIDIGEKSGITIDKDDEDYIIINGTTTANYVPIMSSYFDINDILEDGETYTLWQEKYSESNGGIYLQLRITDENKNKQYIGSSTGKTTLVIDKLTYKYEITLQAFKSGETFVNYKNRYMIYKGTDEKGYEKYGAMPSIDYPSIPNIVTGVQKIKRIGKNLLDMNSWKLGMITDSTGLHNEASGYASTAYDKMIEVKPNTTYTIYGATQRVYEYDKDKNYLGAIKYEGSINYSINTNTFTTSNKTKYIALRYSFIASSAVYKSLQEIQAIKMQIEEGDTATDYEPYTEEIINLDLGNTELCKITDKNGNAVAQDRAVYREVDGVWKWQWEKNIYKVVLKGNETWVSTAAYEGFYRFRIDINDESLSKDATSAVPGLNSHFTQRINQNHGGYEYLYVQTSKSGGSIYIQLKDIKTVEELTALLIEQYNNNSPITIYYVGLKSSYEDCTPAQSETLEKLYKLSLQKGTNNIFVESENGLTADIQLTYMQDNNLLKEQEYKALEDRITALEELLSTTQTSAMLLDNMQSDLESEV